MLEWLFVIKIICSEMKYSEQLTLLHWIDFWKGQGHIRSIEYTSACYTGLNLKDSFRHPLDVTGSST